MPPTWRGEGMNATHTGMSTYSGNFNWSAHRDNHYHHDPRRDLITRSIDHKVRRQEQTIFLSAVTTMRSSASPSRTFGRYAVSTRSPLRADPGPRRLDRTRPKHDGEQKRMTTPPQEPGLTRPRSFRDE
jgi:hypothetical protein